MLSDLYSKYNTQAGFILRGLHLFINIKNLFDHGLRSEGFDMTTAGVVVDDDDSEDEEEPRANSPAPSDHGSQDTQDDSCNPEVDVDGTAEPDDAPENDSFDVDAMRLKEMIPELDDTMDRFKRDTRGLQLFIKMIIRTAKAARGTDTKNFKDAISDYIPCDPTIDVLQPPISASPLKSDRGFNHRMIAPLLVPWHQYAVYKENPSEFITKVLNKEIIITHESCPMFMYDDALYDPKDSEAGFGRGYLFLRGCKHYIGGKNFVFRDPESSKSLSSCTLFHKYRIKTLTPQLIATIACQIRFALCTKQYWRSVDGAFNLRMFYQKVITYLNDPEDEWVQETMKFLHKQVLLKQDEAEDNPDVDDKEPDSEMKNLQSARQARRDARKKAAEEEAKKLAEEERQKKAAEEQAQQTAAAGGEDETGKDETGKDGDGGRGEDDPAQSNDESS
ncbi:hypothetical protein D9758_017817 [Tetrapyrgos nigripes]|uniref:Uncharacterized protein n=1 Tax=Tetrapyrgos nigripes TaxID=182062 RepID=A0A8H5BIJ6_9AGAR|nr:hypothetical protein D9758_017817 [Tetrapyrgos nigripes]